MSSVSSVFPNNKPNPMSDTETMTVNSKMSLSFASDEEADATMKDANHELVHSPPKVSQPGNKRHKGKSINFTPTRTPPSPEASDNENQQLIFTPTRRPSPHDPTEMETQEFEEGFDAWYPERTKTLERTSPTPEAQKRQIRDAITQRNMEINDIIEFLQPGQSFVSLMNIIQHQTHNDETDNPGNNRGIES